MRVEKIGKRKSVSREERVEECEQRRSASREKERVEKE